MRLFQKGFSENSLAMILLHIFFFAAVFTVPGKIARFVFSPAVLGIFFSILVVNLLLALSIIKIKSVVLNTVIFSLTAVFWSVVYAYAIIYAEVYSFDFLVLSLVILLLIFSSMLVLVRRIIAANTYIIILLLPASVIWIYKFGYNTYFGQIIILFMFALLFIINVLRQYWVKNVIREKWKNISQGFRLVFMEKLGFIQSFIDFLSALVIIADSDGNILTLNNSCVKFKGYNLREITGKSVWDIFYHAEEKNHLKSIISGWKNMKNMHCSNYWVSKTESSGLIAWQINCVTAGEMDEHYYILTGIDITERKRIEDKLRAQNESLEKENKRINEELIIAQEDLRYKQAELHKTEQLCEEAFNNAPVAMFRTSLNGDLIIKSNTRFAEMLGYSGEEILSLPMRKIFFNPDAWKKEHEGRGKKTTYDVIEAELMHKVGNKLYSVLSSRISSDAKFIEYSVTDISALKFAEKKIREDELSLRMLIDRLQEKIYIKNAFSVYIACNSAYARHLEINPEKIKGKTDKDIMPEAAAFKNNEEDSRVISSGQPERYEKTLQEKDSKVILERIKIPLKGEDGFTIGMACIEFNVSEVRILEEKLEKAASEARKKEKNYITMETELRKANKEVEQFAYLSSKHIKIPLETVLNRFEKLFGKNKSKFQSEDIESSDFITKGIKKIQTMIQDLLIYARFTSRAKMFEIVDFNNLLDRVFASLALTITDSDAVVSRDNLPSVEVDEDQIFIVFRNIVENALKYVHEKSTPRVRITVESKSDFYIFTVLDNGVGIEDDKIDHVFDLFQEFDPKDKKHGERIGLAICKKIIERHGGQIWVQSKPGEGSAFSFSLPKWR